MHLKFWLRVFMSLVALTAPVLAAESITVTDIAGRTVTLKQPIERMILGEGRQFYLTATLDTDHPFARIVGWQTDLRRVDPGGYAAYREKFPEIDQVPEFGNPGKGAFSAEQAISLKPDVVFMHLQVHTAIKQSGLIDQLAAAGIPVVFVDFRERPLDNTIPSIMLMGRILQKQDRAQTLADFLTRESALVYERLATLKGPRPKVFIERAAGGGFFKSECCETWGAESLGMLVERAGGDIIAATLLPGPTGALNPEQVMTSAPDIYIVTGSDWDALAPGNSAAPVGAGADPKRVNERLRILSERYGFEELPAVKSAQFHAIWHQFYNSPYNFVALQAFAKWIHPETFADIDPDETFRRFHREFLPVDYRGGYFATLDPAS
ncbi:MAG: ABC transporter substrate-binding protein [Alphaproteobacteria bacterium]|nr:ABC transporter substrate-binding protein [Alphaproteobacteria bacterium]